MDVDHIKVFIPSKDYEVSKRFYSQIGFKGEFVSDALTLFENGDCQFFLQIPLHEASGRGSRSLGHMPYGFTTF